MGKVKVVLAAAMWQNPHILILDEPTNYLDREGLGALVLAIKDYTGGVLIISHNKEFCDNVATEKWIMKGGYLRIEGESVETAEDAKKAIKDLEKKLKDGQKKKTLTEEEVWEIQDKLVELKEKLEKAV